MRRAHEADLLATADRIVDLATDLAITKMRGPSVRKRRHLPLNLRQALDATLEPLFAEINHAGRLVRLIDADLGVVARG